MTPEQLGELVDQLDKILDDILSLHSHLFDLVGYLDNMCESRESQTPPTPCGINNQRIRAAKNREDAIDELLRKEGLWW